MVIGALAMLVVAGVVLLSPGFLAWGARRMAARCLDQWSFGRAGWWLAWSRRLAPEDGRTALMQAACYRHFGQFARWRRCVELAAANGAPSGAIRLERELGRIQGGRVPQGREAAVGRLVVAGASPEEAATAFVHGYLAREDPERAAAMLDAWELDFPDSPQLAYMRGVYWLGQGDYAAAEAQLQRAVARQPDHEPARIALAELWEGEDRLEEAFAAYRRVLGRRPDSETARVGLARVLRGLGRIREARRLLAPLAVGPDPTSAAAVEMGHIAFESGDYEAAERWFARADLDHTNDHETLPTAASSLAYQGQTVRAERLFVMIAAANDRLRRLYDLKVRLAVDPDDRDAADQVRRLAPAAIAPSRPPAAAGGPSGGPDAVAAWYQAHCAACHGANGDGRGRAARHLFPRPRDFRTEAFRLVSTENLVPTQADVERVLLHGMPGTSMPAFDHLPADQRSALARETLRLRREGTRDQLVHALKLQGEEIIEEEIQLDVQQCTGPGEVVSVPPIGPADADAVARGREVYFEQGCEKCHGDDGTGVPDTPLFDDRGEPARARDLVHEPFKGGDDPESVYLRNLLGMPGTPHPASTTRDPAELVDLVHYCLSLAQRPKRTWTNYQRACYADGRAYLAAFPPGAQP